MTHQTLGKYRIDGVLGEGGMGVVYKGHDTVIDRDVALKTVHERLLSGEKREDWLRRFQREVRTAGKCLHPNIVTVFDYGEDQGVPFIAMEYVEGRELADYLKSTKLLSERSVYSIIFQVLRALHHAHGLGIVHRDIKPSNIILLKNGLVKVTDFGIALMGSTDLTQKGMAVGTFQYMPPELFCGEKASYTTDLYSTGVVLLELLTGCNPFVGATPAETSYRICFEDPFAKVDLNVTPLLRAVLDKALAKAPEQRFQSANDFTAALKQAMRGAPAVESAAAIKTAERSSIAPAKIDTPVQPPSEPKALEPKDIERVEKELSFYLGPLASILVKRAAKKAKTPEELYRQLAHHIPGAQEKTDFLQNSQRHSHGDSPTGAHSPTDVTVPLVVGNTGTGMHSLPGPEALARIERELARYIGPIAKVLVKQISQQANSVEDLYSRLAEHITNEKNRAAFLEGLVTLKKFLSH